jgi:signal transduction histidine kinase
VIAERFKVELITNVSHDIRTPVTSIINYVDLLKGLPIDTPEFTEYVGVLERTSGRLKTLIGDLIEASKSVTGAVDLQMEQVNLSELVGQATGEFEDRLTAASLTLVLRQPDTSVPRVIEPVGERGAREESPSLETAEHAPVTVHADPSQVWRILENLLGNVVKYALPGTRVFVEVVWPGESETGSVGVPRDRGTLRGSTGHQAGVPYDRDGHLRVVSHDRGGRETVVVRVMNTSRDPLDGLDGATLVEQFVRGDTARSDEGSGLGLYIARNLAELMGGRLTIATVGDLFTAELSLARG